MSGLRIAALYSFPPGRFGLCGMGEESAHEIFHFLLGKRVPKIRKILETFEGAIFYYKLIAKENKISNYFDERVVKAYWIGNEFLEKVRISKLKEMVEKVFKKPKLAKSLPDFARPHHSFHVLVAGPMRRDLEMTEGMKDLCRISSGQILGITNFRSRINELIVEYQPLLKEENWFLGKPIKRKIFWDKRILRKIRIGDWVSFHWDFALEKLSEKDLGTLKRYTQLSVQTANFLLE